MVELDYAATAPGARRTTFPWPNADPIDLAVDSIAACLGTHATDADHGIVAEITNLAHTVVDPESPEGIRVAYVGPLVSQNTH